MSSEFERKVGYEGIKIMYHLGGTDRNNPMPFDKLVEEVEIVPHRIISNLYELRDMRFVTKVRKTKGHFYYLTDEGFTCVNRVLFMD